MQGEVSSGKDERAQTRMEGERDTEEQNLEISFNSQENGCGNLLSVANFGIFFYFFSEMAPRKGKEKKEEQVISLGPQVAEGENVFGVCHIFASFNDTFVHVTDLSGKWVPGGRGTDQNGKGLGEEMPLELGGSLRGSLERIKKFREGKVFGCSVTNTVISQAFEIQERHSVPLCP